MREKKEWKNQGQAAQNEKFKTNPKFETMIEKERTEPDFIANLGAQERLGLHRYRGLKKQAGKN